MDTRDMTGDGVRWETRDGRRRERRDERRMKTWDQRLGGDTGRETEGDETRGGGRWNEGGRENRDERRRRYGTKGCWRDGAREAKIKGGRKEAVQDWGQDNVEQYDLFAYFQN